MSTRSELSPFGGSTPETASSTEAIAVQAPIKVGSTIATGEIIVGATLAGVMFAYYDTDADIAWFPTGESDDVVSERVPGGLRDYDRASHQLVAIEVWDASTRLPASILDALPAPSTPHRAVA